MFKMSKIAPSLLILIETTFAKVTDDDSVESIISKVEMNLRSEINSLKEEINSLKQEICSVSKNLEKNNSKISNDETSKLKSDFENLLNGMQATTVEEREAELKKV